MARKHRGILAAAVLGALGVAVLVVALRVWATYVPDPETASREGLMRWLVLRDLSMEPPETQLAVLERVEQELEHETSVTDTGDTLTPSQRRQLLENVGFLKRFWFQQRLEEYARCSESLRREFVQQQVDKLAAWSRVDAWLASAHADKGASSPDEEGDVLDGSTAPSLISQVETWIEGTPEPQRPMARQAVCEGVVCWLATDDLSDYSMNSRRHLARRIAVHLDAGRRADESASGMSREQRVRLAVNGELLLEAWLYDEKDRYFALPTEKRPAYVDQRIDSFLRWGVLELLAEAPSDSPTEDSRSQAGTSAAAAGNATSTTGGGAGNSLPDVAPASGRTHAELVEAGLKRFLSLVDEWLDRAEPDDRQQLEQLVATIQQRMLVRQLREAMRAWSGS